MRIRAFFRSAAFFAMLGPCAPGSTFAQESSKPAAATKDASSQSVTPDQAEKLLRDKKEVVILDVRTPDEFKAGHIAGAKNVSLIDSDFEQKLKAYEGKPVLVHCGSGARSARALIKMADLQFPQVYHMDAGMKGWLAAGKPVVKE